MNGRDAPRVRIVHVLNSAGLGGGAKQVRTLMHGLHNIDSALVCFEDGALATEMRQRGHGVEIVPLMGARAQPPWRLPRLVQALRRFDPALVHCHGTRAAFNVALVRPWLGNVRTVYTERGLADQPHTALGRRLWGRSVEAFNGRTFDCCVCVSAADLRWTRRRGVFLRDRSLCIRNAIDPRSAPAFDPATRARARAQMNVSEDDEVLLCIGRMEAEKAPLDVIEMLRLVHQERPQTVLVWVGGGRLESAARRAAERAGVASACRFLGDRTDAPELLLGCDVFVLASLWEGLPNVLLEALLAERPCVATRVNGIPEVLSHGRTGYTVEPRQPEALARAVLAVLAAPERALALARAGARHVRTHFQIEAMLAAYAALYASLLGAGVDGGREAPTAPCTTRS